MSARIYSHLTGRLEPKPAPKAPARAPREPAPLAAIENERLTAALRDVDALRVQLEGERARRIQAESEIAAAEDRARQAESRALEAAVRAGEADGARSGLQSALANAQATNTKLASMKPPPPAKPAPPAPATPWKMEVHRDGVGNIREIIATPQGK